MSDLSTTISALGVHLSDLPALVVAIMYGYWRGGGTIHVRIGGCRIKLQRRSRPPRE
jgi:hypothetical protein